MRHFGEVGHDEATLDVLAETDRHGVNARGARLRAKHIAERHDLTVGVGDLDANRTLARNGRKNPHLIARDGVREILIESSDALYLDTGPELDLVAGDRWAAAEAGDAGIHLELIEHLGDRGHDDIVRL